MRKYCTVVILATGISVCYAEETNSNHKSEPVVVTATRTAQTVDDTLSSVTVITQEDIENQQVTSVQELLRSLAGLTVVNEGGEGKSSSLLMRGTNSGHVLLLIDGIKIGSATLGLPAFQSIPVEHIERIEIVRGPRSSLYGSEAIGGVIQIFTKKGGGPVRPSVQVSAGAFETYKAVVGVSGSNKDTWYNASLSDFKTEGFNACDVATGCWTDEPDDDGYTYTSVNLAVGHQFSANTVVDVSYLRSDGEAEFDGSSQNETETVQQVIGAKLLHNVSDNFLISMSVGQNNDKSDNFKDGGFESRFDTKRNTVSIQSEISKINNGELTAGLDYQDDQVDTTEDFSVTSRDNKGVFAQYLIDVGAHSFQISARHDDNEQFGGADTGSFAWGNNISKQLRVMASYGTGFKAPTFNALYWPFGGNSDLEPEESESIELGLEAVAPWGKWSVNIYRTEIDNLIVYVPPTWLPANVEAAEIYGAEFIVSTQLGAWDANIDFTVLDTENRTTGADKGNELPRRAKKSIRVSFDRKYEQYKFGATLIAKSKRFDDPANSIKLDSYYTADIYAGYKMDSDWLLSASVKNLFDEEYQTASSYNQPGRNFMLTVSYKPAN